MERGLIWFPLLAFFIWLTWTGWREYQKVESYQTWATAFDRAKYDIYSVLGQKADELTWGVPTRKGPINLETFSLQGVESVQVQVHGQPIDLTAPPTRGRAELTLISRDRAQPILIPFTEPPLAAKWGEHLQREIQRLKQES